MPEMARNGPQNWLFPRQEDAAILLARGSTVAEAAAGCGAGERTVKRWLTLLRFRQRVSQLRAELTDRCLGQLVDQMASACGTLGFLARKAKSEMVRLLASKAVIETATRLRENCEFSERLAALEAKSNAESIRPARPA
jgi:hypothetical protein